MSRHKGIRSLMLDSLDAQSDRDVRLKQALAAVARRDFQLEQARDLIRRFLAFPSIRGEDHQFIPGTAFACTSADRTPTFCRCGLRDLKSAAEAFLSPPAPPADPSTTPQGAAMHFPATRAELEAAGYIFSDPGRCSSCRATIIWTLTPAKRRMPLDPPQGPEARHHSHFATCPMAAQHRRPR